MDQNGSSQRPAVIYKAQVTTGQGLLTGTLDLISVTLVGPNGESPKRFLDQIGMTCSQGSIMVAFPKRHLEFSRFCLEDLSLLIQGASSVLTFRLSRFRDPGAFRSELEKLLGYRNVTIVSQVEENKSHKPSDDTHGLQRRHRQEELQLQQRTYGWKEYLPNIPWCANIDTTATMEHNITYSFPKLSQHPGPQSPIFLPTDEEWLWTLAKTWVRNAEFHTHEDIAHLLRGHLMSEIFSVATLRTLPMCHPLYKLLIPHLRYSIHINVLARTYLISQGGTFDKAIGTGRQGLAVLLEKALAELTYTQLCLPDDIEARGVGCLLQYYYRDDGLKIWDAIQSFVSGIVGLYYKSDSEVQGDDELQSWVAEIFAKGFLSRETSGVPSALHTVPDLIKYLTMTVFTCSAHHAAVNGGQFEMGAFMPNLPSSMRKPPPQAKTPVTLQEFLDTIPEMNVTSQVLSVLWVLRNETLDMKPLGYYEEEHFVEEGPKRLIGAFQEHLKHITLAIESRNKTLPLPYTYLYPPEIENSTTI
ncbi:hydroperoxide isomerase ALOXE3-like [Protobothrops mucrosquamatus]|uniref:hydroperoxide isomerase ALOXE3-like n=1 Tax=Protobothrops mucrosquamatus TaxID=103944 RepID=UPI0007757F86|nr:hydroperoxide isomerase ALOXE3-like [Protobothrops mucrosquamatus]